MGKENSNSNSNSNSKPEFTEEEKESIERGLNDLKEGKTHSDEEVRSKIKDKINNLDYKDKYLRVYAEFENYKKRKNDQIEFFKSRVKTNLLDGLIDVLDDIEISKENLSDTDTNTDTKKGMKDFLNGTFLIYDKLYSKVKDIGLEKMDCNKGDRFNSDLHEAIGVVDMGEEFKDKIIDITKRGYKIDGNIVKYPKVVVGK